MAAACMRSRRLHAVTRAHCRCLGAGCRTAARYLYGYVLFQRLSRRVFAGCAARPRPWIGLLEDALTRIELLAVAKARYSNVRDGFETEGQEQTIKSSIGSAHEGSDQALVLIVHRDVLTEHHALCPPWAIMQMPGTYYRIAARSMHRGEWVNNTGRRLLAGCPYRSIGQCTVPAQHAHFLNRYS